MIAVMRMQLFGLQAHAWSSDFVERLNSTFTSSTASQRAAPNFENGAREFMLRQAAITHVARGGEAPLAPRNVEERREAEHVVRTAFEADVDGERSMFALP